MDDELQQGYQYARGEMERGVSQHDIRQQLLESGWSSSDVESVFRRLQAERSPFQQPVEVVEEVEVLTPGDYQQSDRWDTAQHDNTGYDDTSFGDGMSYGSQTTARPQTVKGVLMIVGGLLFLGAGVGLIFAAFNAQNGGGRIRGLIWLIIIGGFLLKRGFDALSGKS